jgi:hypothetical protein
LGPGRPHCLMASMTIAMPCPPPMQAVATP